METSPRHLGFSPHEPDPNRNSGSGARRVCRRGRIRDARISHPADQHDLHRARRGPRLLLHAVETLGAGGIGGEVRRPQPRPRDAEVRHQEPAHPSAEDRTEPDVEGELPDKGGLSVPFHRRESSMRGMRGTFTVSAEPAPPPSPPLDVSASAVLTQIGTFARPVFVTAPSDDERIFVVEQLGTGRVIRDGEILPTPFLDLRDQAVATGESGLLSIAFAPDYALRAASYMRSTTLAQGLTGTSGFPVSALSGQRRRRRVVVRT